MRNIFRVAIEENRRVTDAGENDRDRPVDTRATGERADGADDANKRVDGAKTEADDKTKTDATDGGDDTTEDRDWDVSVEDAELMVDEGDRQDAEATVDLERSERLLEVSDGLEDLAVIADQIEEVTPTEQALIANSAQMAVAGTDVEPEEIVPALESGFRSGMEEAKTMRQRASEIWKIVQATLYRIWDNIVGLFRNLIGNGVILESRMKKIKEALKGGYKPGSNPIVITTGASLLCVNGEPVKSGQELVSAVNELSKTVRWCLEVRPGELDEMATGLGTAIKNLDFISEDGDQKFGDDIFNIVNKQLTLPGGEYTKDPRWPNESLQKGADLLGGVSLYARTSKQGDDEQKPLLVKLERVRNSEIVLDASTVNSKAVNEISIPALSDSEMSAVVKGVDEIIDAIANFKKEKGEKRIDAARKKLDEASKQASAEWDKVKDSDKLSSPHTQAIMKAALSLNISFAKWAKEPITGVVRHSMEVCRMVIALLSKNIANAGASADAGKA